MRLRKVMIILLSLCIMSGLVSGCGNSKDKEKSEKVNSTVIGKHIEEEVEIPLKQNETVLRLLKNIEGSIEIYTQGDDGTYKKYISTDGKEWKEEDASWLAQITQAKVVSLSAGKDGNHYAIVSDENTKKYLLKQTGEGTAEEISIPELNKADEEGSEFYSFGTELKVMENGNLILEGSEEVKVYSQSDGNLLYSLPYEKTSTDSKNPVDINGENIVLPSKDKMGFTVWNQEEEKDSMNYGFDVLYGLVILEDNNEIYFLNKDGIHHMQPGGTLVETLVDGASMTMGLPDVYVKDFIKGAGDDFYALYQLSSGKMSVKHYYYDENVKVNSDNTLNIYSLDENNTIRQAVSIFNQKFPEVEVSYMTGDSDSSATRADKIRVLNTELLNKNGADVLVLDNIPINSLIEKGVLKDISNIVNPLIEDGTLRENIANCYKQEDGKIYAMPVRYGVPIIYGDQETIDAMDNLDTLETWLDTHENQPIFTELNYKDLTRLFVSMYYDELFDDKGNLKQENLEKCLSCTKKLGDGTQAEMERIYITDAGEEEYELTGSEYTNWRVGNTAAVLKGKQVASCEIKGFFDMMRPFTVKREKGLPILLNKDIFVPQGLIGINSASSVAEMAEEFIKILFSIEVQELVLDDGLPMNQNAENMLIEQGGVDTEEEQQNGNVLGDDYEGNQVLYFSPFKAEMKEFLEQTKQLKKPAGADKVFLDMIFEEAKMYYEGNQEAEDTVKKIISKWDTYLAE